MKPNLHPEYFDQAKITCVCGQSFVAGSTKSEIKVEICSNCHPFYTGEMKFVDSLGRVERFKQRQAQSKGKTYLKKKERKLLKNLEAEKREASRPKTLKEMLSQKT